MDETVHRSMDGLQLRIYGGYTMTHANPARAIGGGFVATLVMTMMIYIAPHMGMPNMDIAGMLGSVMNGGQTPAAMSGS